MDEKRPQARLLEPFKDGRGDGKGSKSTTPHGITQDAIPKPP
jgi:hypothetical protein